MARPTVDRLYSTEIGHVKLRSVQTGLVSTGALVSRADMEDTIQHPLPNKIVLTRKVRLGCPCLSPPPPSVAPTHDARRTTHDARRATSTPD